MDQTETIAFLRSGAAFPKGGAVDVIETHGAYVFLCGDVALKLKRAVVYDYMDLGTVERRRAMLDRELELNAPGAPAIYGEVLPVTREGGALRLGGDGPAIDWVLRMCRFKASEEFDAIAARGEFDDDLATATGEAVWRHHDVAPVACGPRAGSIPDILDELDRVLADFEGADGTEAVPEWSQAAQAACARHAELLEARRREGHVRRGHGDLHLRNLVRIEGRPILFDALEFNEALGTCDVLYDVAFLIMDLCHEGLDRQACLVLDAWLREARGTEDDGLAVLGLFLSVRASIRAMVALQRDAARGEPDASATEVAAYLALARRALREPVPTITAIGGYSGTGKSVLARALAPGLGAMPGAVLLSSDLERKAGRSKDAALGVEEYGSGSREAVYHAMLDRAGTILAAGHSVIVDATFLDAGLRAEVGAMAERAGVTFHGLWLEAPAEVLEARVRGRHGDASDADIGVLHGQRARPVGPLDWHRLDASGSPEEVLDIAWHGLEDAAPHRWPDV